jgi:outer membrane lipopolysaccharide assembly protein LptE/RlpB
MKLGRLPCRKNFTRHSFARPITPPTFVIPSGRKPARNLLFSAMLLLATAGCGYHTVGHSVQLPANVKTIAIPTFKNETNTYRIEQMLTNSVVREFTTRTHYHILNGSNSNDASDTADATLRGTVLSTSASPLTYNSATGQAASVLIVVSMKVSLSDRQGKVIYQNPAYLFREQYEVSQDLASFFEEDSPAFRRLSQDFARTLVSNILEDY